MADKLLRHPTINMVMISGFLGSAPELRYTAQGTAVLSFRIAHTKKYKDKDGKWVEKTGWHEAEMFGSIAEIMASKLSKGTSVIIEGSLEEDTYLNKDKEKRSRKKIHARKVSVLEKSQGIEEDGEQPAHQISDEDVPF